MEEELNRANAQDSKDDKNVSNIAARNKDFEHTLVDANHAKATRTRHKQVTQRILDEKHIETGFARLRGYPDRHRRWEGAMRFGTTVSW